MERKKKNKLNYKQVILMILIIIALLMVIIVGYLGITQNVRVSLKAEYGNQIDGQYKNLYLVGKEVNNGLYRIIDCHGEGNLIIYSNDEIKNVYDEKSIDKNELLEVENNDIIVITDSLSVIIQRK